MLLIKAVGVDVVDVGSLEPLELLPQVQKIFVDLDDHPHGEPMGELRLQVDLLAVSAQFGLLVSFFFELFGVLVGLSRARSHLHHPRAVDRRGLDARQFFYHLECLDAHQPPVPDFILDEVPHQLSQLDSSVEQQELHDALQGGLGVAQVLALLRLYDGAAIFGASHQLLYFEFLFVEECLLVGDQETSRALVFAVYRAAKEGLRPIALDKPLQAHGLVLLPDLLPGAVGQVPRAHEL